MMPQKLIVNPGIKYVNGLDIARISEKIISMEVGSARDSTNTNDILLNDPISLNGAIVGANGVDVAALVASQLYAVYAIGDSTEYKSTAGLLSLNRVQPNLPGNYDMYRRVGWVLTDSSANIVKFVQNGQGQERNYYYQAGILVLLNGTSTTFAAVNLSTAVPIPKTDVFFLVSYLPSVLDNTLQFLPFGITGGGGSVQFGYGNLNRQIGMATAPCQMDDSGNASVLYKVFSGDSIILNVVGYKDLIT